MASFEQSALKTANIVQILNGRKVFANKDWNNIAPKAPEMFKSILLAEPGRMAFPSLFEHFPIFQAILFEKTFSGRRSLLIIGTIPASKTGKCSKTKRTVGK